MYLYAYRHIDVHAKLWYRRQLYFGNHGASKIKGILGLKLTIFVNFICITDQTWLYLPVCAFLNFVWTIFLWSAPFKLETYQTLKIKSVLWFSFGDKCNNWTHQRRQNGAVCLWLCNKSCRKKGIKAWNCVNVLRVLCFEGKCGSVWLCVC